MRLAPAMVVVLAGLSSCSRPAPADPAEQAGIEIQHRLGANYELHYVARRTVAGVPVICGYAGEKDPPVFAKLPFVYTRGRLYLTEDMGSDSEGFLDRNCGADLPRTHAGFVNDFAPR